MYKKFGCELSYFEIKCFIENRVQRLSVDFCFVFFLLVGKNENLEIKKMKNNTIKK